MTAILTFLGLLLAVSSAANAQIYAGLHGGGNFLQDSDVDGSGINGKGETDAGFVAGGVLGYRFGVTDNLSVDVEGEFSYRYNDVDQFSASGFSANSGGYVQSFIWMANGWLNWQIGDSGFMPYAGGGFGGVHIDIKDAAIAGVRFGNDSDFVIGGQLGGGLGYQIDEHFAVSLDYRFLITDDANFQGLDVEYQSHSVMAGIKYLF
ncbi:outer membrane protein [Pelagibius marinus]|uniref:outer membrane protein n=1 Tax=Pelagibius marinus TaxID=2762760 RepID=UPI0018726402|nr:outer membrane beta-barrel protein [Pelagibius marinus]